MRKSETTKGANIIDRGNDHVMRAIAETLRTREADEPLVGAEMVRRISALTALG